MAAHKKTHVKLNRGINTSAHTGFYAAKVGFTWVSLCDTCSLLRYKKCPDRSHERVDPAQIDLFGAYFVFNWRTLHQTAVLLPLQLSILHKLVLFLGFSGIRGNVPAGAFDSQCLLYLH